MAGAIAVNNNRRVRNDMRLQRPPLRRWVFELQAPAMTAPRLDTGPLPHQSTCGRAAIMRGPKIATTPGTRIVRRNPERNRARGHPDPGRSSSSPDQTHVVVRITSPATLERTTPVVLIPAMTSVLTPRVRKVVGALVSRHVKTPPSRPGLVVRMLRAGEKLGKCTGRPRARACRAAVQTPREMERRQPSRKVPAAFL